MQPQNSFYSESVVIFYFLWQIYFKILAIFITSSLPKWLYTYCTLNIHIEFKVHFCDLCCTRLVTFGPTDSMNLRLGLQGLIIFNSISVKIPLCISIEKEKAEKNDTLLKQLFLYFYTYLYFLCLTNTTIHALQPFV